MKNPKRPKTGPAVFKCLTPSCTKYGKPFFCATCADAIAFAKRLREAFK